MLYYRILLNATLNGMKNKFASVGIQKCKSQD